MAGPTNFQNGVASFGFPVLPAIPGPPAPNAAPTLTAVGSGQTVSGPSNVYFVSSTIGQDGNTGRHMKTGGPLATLVQALTMVSPGDTIYLMPGHVETIIAAAGVDVKVKCLQIIGMGAGNQRPQIVFKTSTAATFRFNATTGDGCYLYNVRVQSQIGAQAVGFVVAAKDVTLDTVDYYDDAASDLTVFAQVTGINCTIKNCYHVSLVTQTATLNWVTINAAHGFRFYNNYMYIAGKSTANPANGILVGVTALSKNVDIRANLLSIDLSAGTGSVPLSLFTGTTGMAGFNLANSTGKTAIAGAIALASCMGINNYSTHTANKNGLLDPVVDS